MSRYIKMTDAVKVMACEMYAEAQSQGYEADGVEDFMPEAKAWITDAPSIDLVFCEDCRDCVEKGAGVDCPSGYGYLYCRRKKSVVNEDDYCSWGERR